MLAIGRRQHATEVLRECLRVRAPGVRTDERSCVRYANFCNVET